MSFQRPIVIFIPTLTAGGAERVASVLANEWCRSDEVMVVTLFDVPHFYTLDERIRVVCLGFSPRRPLASRLSDVAKALVKFRSVCVRAKPWFVLSFMNKYNAFCITSLIGTKIPVVVSERDSPDKKLPAIRVLARNLLYPVASGLICQTGAGLEFICRETRVAMAAVIANPVNRFLDPRSRRPEKLVLHVGRMDPEKGHQDLLEAFAAARMEDWRLVLCGDGPLRPMLEGRAKALGITDRVEFAGVVRDLAQYHRRAGMFVFPSYFEGYPNALAEALVSGIPSISYDCPTGPSELIQAGENGLLVPVADVAGLALCMQRLAADSSLSKRLGESAAEIAGQLEPAAIAGEYLRFCAACADGGIQR